MRRFTRFVAAACLTLTGQMFCRAADPKDLIGDEKLPADANLVGDLAHLMRTAGYAGADRKGEWSPTDERSRGSIADVYGKVAPAVVLIRTSFGHGTGFLVRNNWLLTNHHVVTDARYSSKDGGQVVDVNLGKLGADEWMERIADTRKGLVHRTCVRRDLAIVKLVDVPSEPLTTSPIKLAKKVPGPNSVCVAIGHPARGMLWTTRRGELVGVGTFPDDQVETVTALLGVSGLERRLIESVIKRSPERHRVVVSSCGLNPGDSGGPLVDTKGRLIGVSYAVPALSGDVGVGNFSYHVHLDEVATFLADWPKGPTVDAPNPLPMGAYQTYRDEDADGSFETMAFGLEPQGVLTGIAMDLDGDSYGGLTAQKLAQLDGALSLVDWDYEFVLAAVPQLRYSFDTDNDGSIDLVFSDEDLDENLDTEIRLKDGKWQVSEEKSPKLSGGLFRDSALKERFDELMSSPSPEE